MYKNLWLRYLPIIRIVMKRSLTAEQMLSLNTADFERAGIKRKSGHKFSFGLRDGKLKNVITDVPLASSLASVLLEDDIVRELASQNEFYFALSPKYELTIRHVHPALATTA